MDLRETKHSSVKEDQDAKSRQRVLGFVSKVGRREVVMHCAARLLILNLLNTAEIPLVCAHYPKAVATKHLSVQLRQVTPFFLLKVSRTALTWITQKVSAEPQPCKRCSDRLGDGSGEQIKVYHGEQSVLSSCSEYVILVS